MGLQMVDYLHHLILPTIVLGIGGIAGTMRIMRANFIDSMRAEFVTTARAKGLREGIIMFVHVFRNAINPLITSLGYAFASLLSGALLVENVMNYPGLGQLIYDALIREDQYVVMAGVLVGVTLLALGNLLADLLLGWVDPRIRVESEETSSKKKNAHYSQWLFLILFALIGGEILLESYFPSGLLVIAQCLKWVGLLIVALIALACIAMVAYLLFVMAKRLLIPIFKRTSGAIAFSVLAILYFFSGFASFFAPYSVSEQNLSFPYHPPSNIQFVEGHFEVNLMERVQVGVAQYQATGETARLEFFSKSEPYQLFGFIPMSYKFVQLESRMQTIVSICSARIRQGEIFLVGSYMVLKFPYRLD